MNKIETQKRVSQIVGWDKKPAKPVLKYYSRLNVFKNSRLHFNPETMLATSYEWYNICQMINGKVYLNNYSYSSSTMKHYYTLSSLLDQLGIKYKTLEAPRGLQNLQASVNHYVEQTAKLFVLNKYGTQKRNVRIYKNKFKELASFGYSFTFEQYNAAIDRQENARKNRLVRQQKARIDKKVIAIAGRDAVL